MKYYVVDAFAEKVFEGNPAGVCVLDQWLPDSLMQDIASENNLAETAFTVKEADGYHLRWFTPGGEIDLCGHATLAAAYVLFHFYEQGAERITFQTMSGRLEVSRACGRYEMDFPAYSLTQVEVTEEMAEAIGVRPLEAWMGRDLVCVLEHEAQVRAVEPDQEKVRGLDGLLLHVTARGTDYDCVSRTFAPKMGSPRTRSAVPATVTSSRSGRTNRKRTFWLPGRRPGAAGLSTAAETETGSGWRETRFSTRRRS